MLVGDRGILTKLILEPPRGVPHGVPFPVMCPARQTRPCPLLKAGLFDLFPRIQISGWHLTGCSTVGMNPPLSRPVAEIFLLLGRRRAVCETLNSYGFYRSVRHIKCCAISSRSNKASFLSSAA